MVSIIIPTFNRVHSILKTLDTVVNQTYSDIEVIIIDDGSIDNTDVLIHDHIKKNSLQDKVTYYFQENKGVSAARNNGLRMAKGEYVIFLDSDDFMLPNRVEEQVKAMIAEKSDIGCCGVLFKSSNIEFIPPKATGNPIFLFCRKYNNIKIGTQAWMIRRNKLIEVNGYDESLTCFEDVDLVFRVLSQTSILSTQASVLTIFNDFDSEDRLSNNLSGFSDKSIQGFVVFSQRIITFLCREKMYKSLFSFMDYISAYLFTYSKLKGREASNAVYMKLNLELSSLNVLSSITVKCLFLFGFNMRKFIK